MERRKLSKPQNENSIYYIEIIYREWNDEFEQIPALISPDN